MAEVRTWKARTIAFALALLVLAIVAASLRAPATALYLVQFQDLPILFLAAAVIFLFVFWQPRWALPARAPPAWSLAGVAVALFVLLAWGTYSLLGNFPLSRDEQMVLFDMQIFDGGRLVQPIAVEWRPYAKALVPEFLLNPNEPIGFASFYLPMNALLRLLFSKVADPALFNPLLAVAGGVALLIIARRTFPDDRRPWLVALLVYGLSAQLLVNAMTAYSMTAHAALNLVWLAAFLRGGRAGHATAIATGFVATGLHQLVFHPIFVAPFILWRLRDGEWKVATGYALAYAVIILWWAYYPTMLAPLVAAADAPAARQNVLLEQALPLLFQHDPRTLSLMMLNLLRFVAWQNLALWPLLIAAAPVIYRQRGLARVLVAGIFLWLLFLTLFVPWQGRGWGYRYLHPYLGSFALLAAFGYRELERHLGRRADGLVIALSGVTAFIAIPVLLVSTYNFMQPHLRMQQLIAAQRTPFVVVDDTPADTVGNAWSDTAREHVRNLPDLSNRPLRLSGTELMTGLLAELCRRGSVTVISRADMHRVGFITNVSTDSPRFDPMIKAALRQSPACFHAAAPLDQSGAG